MRIRVRPLHVQQLSIRHLVDHSSSDSSSRHSWSDHSSPDLPSTSAGPSRKRRRSSMTSVPTLPLISEALSPVRADLTPSPKRVRDIGYLADIEVGPRETRVERVTHPAMPEDIPKPAQEGAAEREQGHRIVGVESAVTPVTGRVDELERDNQRLRGTVSVESQRVDRLQRGMSPEEIEARKAARNLETLNENKKEQEGENGGNENKGIRGNGNRGNGENGNHGMDYRCFMPMARECTFQDFLKCKPDTFSRTVGVVGLTRWFEKMETVFNISNCPPKYQVKYATCTLQNSALTKRTIGVDAAYAMKWAGLIKLMTEVYCPGNEVQKMEDKVERFIRGLPDNIQGNVVAANPARLQDAIRIANHNRHSRGKIHVARAYTTGNNERKGYVGSFPYCNKCMLHHEGLCTIRCGNCKKVMAISIILISSDSSGDSIGTPTGRVILFGTIPTTILDTTPVIAPSTIETPIIAPTIPPSLDYTPASPDYSHASETESDPSKDPSSGHIPPLPAILPFLILDDDTTDSDTPDTPPSPTHDTPFTEITAST
nr:hypothetical protein [Tanacetum cinerariifolium]